jgi:hypothetical protein
MPGPFSRRTFLNGQAPHRRSRSFPHILRSETAPSNQLTRALLGFGGIARSAIT